jgi:hypothetical protein
MSILSRITNQSADPARDADLAWFAAHPLRSHRTREMTRAERKQIRRPLRLDLLDLPAGSRWIIVTRRGDGGIQRIPAALASDVDPAVLSESQSRGLFESSIGPWRDWCRSRGLKHVGAAA